jgi:predicted MFS family arabinose efflux permease
MLPQALIPHWSATGLGLIGTSALTSIATAVYTVHSQESVPTRWRSTISGAYFVAATLGMAVAASRGGYLIAAWGYPVLFMIGAGLIVASTLLFWGRSCAPHRNWARRPVLDTAKQA